MCFDPCPTYGWRKFLRNFQNLLTGVKLFTKAVDKIVDTLFIIRFIASQNWGLSSMDNNYPFFIKNCKIYQLIDIVLHLCRFLLAEAQRLLQNMLSVGIDTLLNDHVYNFR